MANRFLSGILLGALLLATGCPQLNQAVSTTQADQPSAFTGKVLGLDGKPAANVLVHGYLISNNSGSLISNNSGSLGSNAAAYRVLSDQLETRTDPEGRFSLKTNEGSQLNIEAILSDDVKAMQLSVPGASTGLQLQLAFTGAIAGRVTAPERPEVTNLQGVDVYVPGTSYLAKTDQGGNFALANVAVGAFALAAAKTGLGSAAAAGVTVTSKHTTAAPDLKLSLATPALTQVVPANGGPGATITLSGSNFGTTSGDTLQVLFGGTPATQVQRLDDSTLKVVVPNGAETGEIVLSVGGTAGSGFPFTVLRSLRLDPGNALLIPGDVLAVSALALDTRGDVVSNPAVTWSVTGSSVSLSSGAANANSTGDALIQVSSGRVTSIRKLTVLERHPSVSLLAGGSYGYAEGTGAAARFDGIGGLFAQLDGTLLVADSGNHRLRSVTLPDGVVTTFAGEGTDAHRDGALLAAQMRMPLQFARDPQNGDLYLTDAYDVIRKITPEGQVSTYAGTGVTGYQDGPAAQAQFSNPSGIAVDDQHNVFVVDRGNHCIRKIGADGQVSTFAGNVRKGNSDGLKGSARFDDPNALVRGGDGHFYVSDSVNQNIRKMTPDGMVTTLAGSGKFGYYDGNGQEASFGAPYGLAVDGASRVYVADFMNNCLRMITPDGMVTTFAGSGAAGGKNGPAPGAQFHYPATIAVDASGTLFVSENGSPRIRRIAR